VHRLSDGQEQDVHGLPAGALYAYWQNAMAWDRTGQQLAISWTASRAAPNVWLRTDGESTARKITAAGGLALAEEELVEPEHVRYPTFDGRHIPALFYPGQRKGPCVVLVHGGPEGQYRPT